MAIKIIYEDDTELAEYEALNKGYRRDVWIQIDKKRYKLYITEMTRLYQDYQTEIQDGPRFYNEPNMIIVKEVSKNEIENTVNELYQGGFFQLLGYAE